MWLNLQQQLTSYTVTDDTVNEQCSCFQQQQSIVLQPFNPGKPGDTVGHINPAVITILLSTSNQSPFTTNQRIFLTQL